MSTGAAVGLGVGLLVLLVVWFPLEVRLRVDAKRRALLRELPRLLAEDEPKVLPLLALEVLQPGSGEDAGPFLNERVGWEFGLGTLLSADCRRAVQGDGWKAVPRERLGQCDTRWLHELRRFGRWSLLPGPRERLAPGPRTEMSFPSALELNAAVKLHLLTAEDREEAARDVRHLARLVITQDYLLTFMVGTQLLSLEAEWWADQGRTWSEPPLGAADLELLRQHFVLLPMLDNPLAAELKPTRDAISGLRRRILETEACFAGRQTQSELEHARWELAHPLVLGVGVELLSVPAQLGAAITRPFAPAWWAELAAQATAADGLPAGARWESRVPESTQRALDRDW